MDKEYLQNLLISLTTGTNYNWYNNKKKLPSTQDSNFTENWLYGLTCDKMLEIIEFAKKPGFDGVVILVDTDRFEPRCSCMGCGIFSHIKQIYVGFWEENNRINHRTITVKWNDMMDGCDKESVNIEKDQQMSLFNVIKDNENLIFTVASYFGTELIYNSI